MRWVISAVPEGTFCACYVQEITDAGAKRCDRVRVAVPKRSGRERLRRIQRVRKAAGRFTRHRVLLTATILAILC